MTTDPQGWRRFLNEEQDPASVEQLYGKIMQLLTAGEDIHYIAVQKKLGVTLSPVAVIITTKRIIIYKARMMGQIAFEDHPWRDLQDARVNESMMGASLTFQFTNGQQTVVDSLPKAQARRIYQIAQEREEQMREDRRQRELEDRRAAAGGVYVGAAAMPPPAAAPPSPPPAVLDAGPAPEDPVARLKQLKAMLDADLITQAEYDTKKAEILRRM